METSASINPFTLAAVGDRKRVHAEVDYDERSGSGSGEDSSAPLVPAAKKPALANKAAKAATPAAEARKAKAAEKAAEKAAAKAAERPGGLTIEQHRRAVGDAVKAKISMEKFTIAARTMVNVTMLPEVFRALVAPNCTVIPAQWDASTEVVVASSRNAEAIAEICGSSKIKGGNMYAHFSAKKMDFIYVPATNQLRIWWTMCG